MNLAAIETFLAIVETGSLTRAAARLNVTQSTVSARLNGLEDSLGQKLFSRRKSGTELTYAGFGFQRHAQLMNDVWRQARRESSLPPNTTTVCNIGCHMDLWSGLGKIFLDAITARQPDVALSAWPGEQRDMDHWLDIGLIDAAICFSPTVHDGTTAHGLADDELVLVSTLPAAGDYARHIRHPAFVYADNGEEFRRQYAATFPDTPNPVITFGCAAWARDHLLMQGGAAYLPRRLLGGATALRVVESAPVFRRMASLVVNNRAADGWPWLPAILAQMEGLQGETPLTIRQSNSPSSSRT